MRAEKVCLAALCALLLSGCGEREAKAAEPITLTVWSYYAGEQLMAFDALVDTYNETVGKEKGVHIESVSQGTEADLTDHLTAAVKGEAGADEVPDLFAAYSNEAYGFDALGCLANLEDYLSKEQLSRYVEGYVDEGRIGGAGLKIFPIAKSVEMLALNQTDWDRFADATGADEATLSTVEGVTAAAEEYYRWTDSQTAAPNDGRALFGRDAMANYFFSGFMQLGTELITVDGGTAALHFEKPIVRTLWDHYYVPYVKGYFTASARFRSDDLKTGNVLACVCSSSSASFLPDRVVVSDTEAHDVEMEILPCPQFCGGRRYAIQQGAGMSVINKGEAQVQSCVDFLLWLTDAQRNIGFSVASGYLPVTKEATGMDAIRKSHPNLDGLMDAVLSVSVETVQENALYAPPPFDGGSGVRGILDHCMSDRAQADRAKVEERLAAGESLLDATEPYLKDAYFDAWYEETLAALLSRMQR